MDVIAGLLGGFSSAVSMNNLFACFLGVFVGTVVGVLPGIGPTGAMTLLLPLSFGMDTGASLIMLSGIYYGSMYGGSTTSILLNVPGEAASVVTCLDGYQLARKGRAGAALAVAGVGSFIAGTVGIILIMLFAPPLGRAALAFGPPEFFGIAVVGMLMLSNLSGGSFLKSILTFIIGMMCATVGIDTISGFIRLTFGVHELSRGIEFLPVAMGLFGMTEVLSVAVEPYNIKDAIKIKFKELYPNRQEAKKSIWPIIRGSFIGFPVGLIPGPAAVLSSLISYRVEKSMSKHPEEFGQGAIEGVAGPESANNAASAGAMVPLLALGIPFAPTTAVLLGGLMIHGVTPGPTFITDHSDLFWLVVASMYIGNLILIILNLPLVGFFSKLTTLSPTVLMPIVTSVMFIGVYSLNNSWFDMALLLLFGLIGYVLKHFDYPSTPLLIGLVLGPVFETGLRQGLIMGQGNLLVFVQRPVSGTLLAIAAMILAWTLYSERRKSLILDLPIDSE